MIWSRGVGPVCLPFYYPDADFSGVDVIATGWGTTEFGWVKFGIIFKRIFYEIQNFLLTFRRKKIQLFTKS